MKEFLIGVGVLAILVDVFWGIFKKRKLRKSLKENFGKIPVPKYNQNHMESIASYWQQKCNAGFIKFAVDDTTWNDLDMDKIYMRINNTQTSIGDEVLYCILHEQEYNAEKLMKLQNVVEYFDSHEDERLRIQFYLAKLGKEPYSGLIDFLFHPDNKMLKYAIIYPVLSIVTLLSVVAIFFIKTYGILFFCLMTVVNLLIYYKTKFSLDARLNSVNYFSALMAAAKKISKIKMNEIDQYAAKIKEFYVPLKKVCNLSNAITYKASSELDILIYIKILFMLDFVMYNAMVSAIIRHNKECIKIYEIIGFLDAAISIASYRKSLSSYTVPQFTDMEKIEMKDIVHPLLTDPVPNTVTIPKSALITGSNASGKSTFVKALAVNAILAQTINTCTASKFCIKPSFIVTSMAVSDNTETGESYYIAEIKSLKRILDGLSKDIRCLCFIDEILKGTNTIERIAASAAILDYLKNKNCLVLVATHDIELTEMIDSAYGNYHFQEHITENGINFDYKIYEDRATTKNAIRLLEFMDYDRQITEKANKLAQEFEENRVWLKL